MLLICTIGIVIGFLATFIVAGKICKVMNRNTFGTTHAYIHRYLVVWAVVLVVYGLMLEFTGVFNYWDHLKSGEENTNNSAEAIEATEMVFDHETQAITEYDALEDVPTADSYGQESSAAPIEYAEPVKNTEAKPSMQEYTEVKETYTPLQPEKPTEVDPIPPETTATEEPYIPPQTEECVQTETPAHENFNGVWISEAGGTRMDIVQQTGDTYTAKMYRTISETEMKYWELNASIDLYSDNMLNFDGTYYVLVSVDGTYGNQDAGSHVSGYMTVNNGQLIVHYELNGGYYQVELYGPN